jgi:voltage-gated potassium channel
VAKDSAKNFVYGRWLALALATPAFYLLLAPPSPVAVWLGQGLYALQAVLWWHVLSGHHWPQGHARWWRTYGLNWVLMCGAALSTLPPLAAAHPLAEIEWGLRIAYSGLVFTRLLLELRFLLASHRIAHIMAMALGCLLVAGLGFYWLEPTVHSYEEGLWLAFTSGATVGYGDIVPTTPAARLFAVFMVLIGFALLSVFTATLSALLVGEDEKRLQRELHHNMQSLHAEIAALRAEIKTLQTAQLQTSQAEAASSTMQA